MPLCSLSILLPLLAFAQGDPREHHHGAALDSFTDAQGVHFLAAWSSSNTQIWEHDVYVQRFHFENGLFTPEMLPLRAIGTGTDGAQEPPDLAFHNGLALTSWEDGTGATVDVHAILHDARGNMIRSEWIVAGGADSQHSASVAAFGRGFLVAYADEAPPADFAMVEARIFDRFGQEQAQLDLSPTHLDNWWPVAVGDSAQTALVAWGDYSDLSASIITMSAQGPSVQSLGVVVQGIDQYFYQVRWLEELDAYLILARTTLHTGAVLVDRSGNTLATASLPFPLLRESTPAILWVPSANAYKVVTSTGSNDVVEIKVMGSQITLHDFHNGDTVPELQNITWVKTGMSAMFAQDRDGSNTWNGNNHILFLQNQDGNDDPHYVSVPLPQGF